VGFIVPDWAVGVGIIIVALSVRRVLPRLLGAYADRLSPPKPRSAEQAEDLSQVREALDDMQKRLGELEERVDFTERALVKQREADRLRPPT